MEDLRRKQEIRAEAWLLLVVLIWAANYPLAKWAISGMNVFIFNAIRFLVAALVTTSIFFSKAAWVHIDRPAWRGIVTTGLVAHVVYQVIFLYGLSMTSAGNAAVLLSTSPLWTLFINAKLHKEKIQKMIWMGMAISLAGIALIIIGSGKKIEFGGTAILGDLISLTAAMLWGLHTNLQKPLVVNYSVFQVTFLMLAVGGIGLSVVALPYAFTFPWSATPWTYYLAAISSGAVSIGVGNILWSNGVKRLGPGRTSNFNNLIPVIAFVISYLTLHEEISGIQLIGVGITIVGVWSARK